MNKYLLAAIVLISTVLLSYAGITLITKYKMENLKFVIVDNYDDNYKAVEKLANNGLYRDAMNACELLLKKALTENNTPQVIKAVVHKIKYSQQIDEQSVTKALYELDSLATKVKSPAKEVLHSITGDGYWQYYQNNRYQFTNRTQAVDFKNDDISTWDLTKIITECVHQHTLSLSNAKTLQTTPVNDYKAILVKGKESEKYRPTLYDVLAYRAIDFFDNGEARVIKPLETFNINEDAYLTDATTFINQKISTTDTLSFDYHLTKTLQELIQFHTTKNNLIPLIDADIKRIVVIHQKSNNANKDSLYKAALQNIVRTHSTEPYAQLANYHLAQWYVGHHNDDKNKTYKKTAHDIATKGVQASTDENIKAKFQNLLRTIEGETINITLENVNLPNQPFIAKINYTNATKVKFRVVKLDMKQLREAQAKERMYNDNGVQPYPLAVSKYIYSQATVNEWTETLPDDKQYLNNTLLYKMPAIANTGLYAIISSNTDNTAIYNDETCTYALTQITNLGILSEVNNKFNTVTGFIVNRNNNTPVADATVEFVRQYDEYKKGTYTTRYATAYSLVTNANGAYNLAKIAQDISYTYHIKTKTDEYYSDLSIYVYKTYDYQEPEYTTYSTLFFTDRAIYRPTQLIHVKGLCTVTQKHDTKIVPNQNITVTLYDANHQKVESRDVITNEFGTYATTFTAPNTGMNGVMTIGDNYGTTNIRVEEYKRPLFEITPKPLVDNYNLNDEVKIEGVAKAYSGAPISGAKVAYRITRQTRIPYWWRCYNPWYVSNDITEMLSGTGTTNDTGAYIINFKAVPDASVSKQSAASFRYTVYTTITDVNGETHTTEQAVTIGYVGVGLTLYNENELLIKQKSKTDSLHFSITTDNLNGQHVPSTVRLKITKLKQPNTFFRNSVLHDDKCNQHLYTAEQWYKWFPEDEYNNENDYTTWAEGEVIYNENIKTIALNHKLNVPCSQWLNGKYKVEAITTDKKNNEVKEISYVDVTNLNDTKTIQDKLLMINTSTDAVSSYALLSPHITKCIKTTALNASAYTQALASIDSYVTNETSTNRLVLISYYHNNRFYSTELLFAPINKTIVKNESIALTLLTLRDKLQPGAKEQWKLKVSSSNKTIPLAEMVATMYDASLDNFAPHHFSSVYAQRPEWYIKQEEQPYFSWAIDDENTVSANVYKYDSYKNYQDNVYDYLNLFGLNWNNNHRYYGRGGGREMYKSMANRNAGDVSDDAAPVMEMASAPMDMEKKASPRATSAGVGAKAMDKNDAKEEQQSLRQEKDNAPEKPKEEVAVRKNKNETAFFFPQLVSDAQGEFTMNFTMPEALTKWKMLAYAHTKDLKQAQTQHSVVTQKEVMVVPNWPRFVREDDSITITAKIVNLTNTPLKGKAYIELVNPLTNEKIKYLQGSSMHLFEVASANNTTVSFTLHINELKDALQATIYATAGAHSDAEQTILTVLPNRMLVTESMPMPIRSKQTKTFSFTKLVTNNSTTLTHYNYAIEFTQNPAWLAIKALPYLARYQFDCADGLANKLFANSLSSYIVNSSPVIENVFKQWQQDPEALVSPLEKNQELKSALLQETPWVLNAQAETQQRKDIAKFFDKNNLANELKTTYEKLKELQAPSGAFRWWKGDRYDNQFLTQRVLNTFAKLIHSNVITKDTYEGEAQLISKALAYLDMEMQKEYVFLNKNKNWKTYNYSSASSIEYLHLRSIFIANEFKLSSNYKEMFDYHIAQTQKYWLQHTRYTQAVAALTLHYNKDATTPKTILASLKNNSINSEEMGAYWKDTYEYFNWYQQPIEAQAMTINAFSEISTDKKFIDDMKTWLLKSKQTQQWPSSAATVEAVYALLLSDANSMSNWLSTDNSIVVKAGNITIDPATDKTIKTESGTGYFKKSFNKTEIQNNMGTVTVTKNNEGVSWGAAYWQYFERLDKITQHSTGLSIKKDLFVEINTPTGPVIKPINKQQLKIGDKVKVRIEIRADRSFSYLHLKDMRAAGFEPVNVLSQYKYQDGLGYYESTRDAATHFFFNYLEKGTHVFEYSVYATHAGTFNNGITSMQCFYAPEFTTHSQGNVVTVK
ncbi:MAG: alpha-2-macroglobulin family protein [Bacteroidia bacterium]